VERGRFAFEDMYNKRKNGNRKLVCQLTIRAGKVVYDLNGISSDPWNGPAMSDYRLAGHWTTITTRDEKKMDYPPTDSVPYPPTPFVLH
jgi:dihydroorotase